MKTAVLLIDSKGTARCLYTELIDLSTIGLLHTERASSIEFNDRKQLWEVRDTHGKSLYGNPSRALCLQWEEHHFSYQLVTRSSTPRMTYA